MKKPNIAIACDHAGFYIKEILIEFLIKEGYKIRDFGTDSEESVDYPDFGHPMVRAVENNEYDYGISICGSGNGINMVANKYPGIRSALCWNIEIAKLARAHNNANICALPGRFINQAQAIAIIKVFLNTKFDGGRHEKRIKKIPILP